jgi:hypothetical protein
MEELNASPLGGSGKIVAIDESWLGGRSQDKHKPPRKNARQNSKFLASQSAAGESIYSGSAMLGLKQSSRF